MKIGILTGGTSWHIQDLQRACLLRHHEAVLLDYRQIHTQFGLEQFDAILVRTMPPGSLEQVIFRMDLLHHLEHVGTLVLNPPKAVETCVDKFLTDVRLRQAGLPVPLTTVCQQARDALSAFEQLGGDVVVKPLFGSQGRGMVRVSDKQLAWRTFHAIEQTGGVIYLQQFLRHPGFDVRAFVLDGKILAAMRRINRDDWRTNVAQGGTTEKLELSNDLVSLALRAAQATGAIVAGVDLIQNEHGEWFVLEVNAIAGWRALAETCGIDVAQEMIRCVEERRRG